MAEKQQYKVFKIEQGTVIDHIPSPRGLAVFRLLSKNKDSLISIGLNFTSNSVGKKDIIKFEGKALSKKETDKISLIAPEATINIIKNSEVIEKRQMDVPSEINGLLKCLNPNCITNLEKIENRFQVIEKKPVKVICHYCERSAIVVPDMVDKAE